MWAQLCKWSGIGADKGNMGQGERKIAVVLFNLGGPDSLEAVRPFLVNLFSDPAIIRLPRAVRALLARVIAWRRAPVAREIYAQMGGSSPLLRETEKQGELLEKALADVGRVKVLPVMRYWDPRADEVARQIAAFEPDCLVLLPLYPQYSTTTTQSSLDDWTSALDVDQLSYPVYTIYCYPQDGLFIGTHAARIREVLDDVVELKNVRVLFSAHGLPKRVVDSGDPYQRQIEQTVSAVVKELDIAALDTVVCYQSRVGPLEWIGPATEDEIRRAGREGKSLVVVPIAFVSEHSETLVELDIEYRILAEGVGVPDYRRVSALNTAPGFISSLEGLVRLALTHESSIWPKGAERPSEALVNLGPASVVEV